MKTLFCLLAAALLCGCNRAADQKINELEKRLDAQTDAINQMSNLLVQTRGDIATNLVAAYAAINLADRIDNKFNGDFDWVATNVADLKIKTEILLIDYDLRQAEKRGQFAAALAKKYGAAYATNYLRGLDPATGLPDVK